MKTRTMKIFTMLAAIVALVTLPAAAAPPTIDADGRTLTVTGAEVASVRPAAPATPEPTLADGVALLDDGLAFTADGPIVWRLSAGVYTVTALSAPDTDGVRETVTQTVTVDAPPPPTRAQRIRAATLAFFQAASDLRALNPTDQEVFAAFRGE